MTHNVPYTTGGASPVCKEPKRIAGRTFGELATDEFACPPEILSAPRYVEAEAGKCKTVESDMTLRYFILSN